MPMKRRKWGGGVDEYTLNLKASLSIPTPKIRISCPFLQRLKKEEDVKLKKFLSMFKNLSINILFVDSFLEMLDYAMFMKYLVIKKRTVDFEKN